MVAVLGDRFCPDGKHEEKHPNEAAKGSEVQRDPWPLGDLPLRTQRPSQIPLCNPVNSPQTMPCSRMLSVRCYLRPSTRVWQDADTCWTKCLLAFQQGDVEGVLVQER